MESGEEGVDEGLCLLLEKDEEFFAAAGFQLRFRELFFDQGYYVCGKLLVVGVASEMCGEG